MRHCTLAMLIVTLWGTSLLPAPSRAANQYFMPGDAFFHSRLTEKVLERIAKEKSPTFAYDRPEFLPRMFCGYAGFSHLQYVEMPRGMRDNLRRVYRDLRRRHPRRVEITDEVRVIKSDEGDKQEPTGRKLQREINGLSVFFYNASFDISKHRLALKYNEKWVDNFVAYGHKRDHALLETFVPDAKAVATEWRDGPLVKPLNAVTPEMTVKNFRRPIKVKQDVVAYVVANPDFNELYSPKDGPVFGKRFMEVFRVTSKGMTRLYVNGGRWSDKPRRGATGVDVF